MSVVFEIKHYQILSLLGEGGFGEVYEAWDNKLHRNVAIKRLKSDGLLPPSKDLIREARTAASLNHPAFVKIHALEDDNNSQAIVMELIKGETLKCVISNSPPDLAQAINIIRQTAEAMQQAHDVGLTHGDLKPSNIMLEPSGVVRILDFGLASKADAQATTSMLQQDPQGTIAYMAPERLLGAPLSPQIDIYALGVIFYELLNKQRPFAELNGLALAAALVQSSSDQWYHPNHIPSSLVRLIRRMTTKKTSERVASMTKILVELDAYEKGISLDQDKVKPNLILGSSENTNFPRKQYPGYIKKTVLLSLLVISCVVFGVWLTRSVLWHFEEVIPRYSESQEMKLGMDALEKWDRPGSLDKAIKHFNNLVEQDSKNAAAIAGLSIAYYARYETDRVDELLQQKAFAAAEQSMNLNPHLAISQIAYGQSMLGKGNWDAALNASEKALSLDPENFMAWNLKAKSLNKMGKTNEAIQTAELAIQKFPSRQAFADLIGTIYVNKGAYLDAERAFQKSIRMQPDSVYSYANLSGVLLEQGRTEEALNVLQRGLEIRPSAWLYTNLGTLYFYEGQYLAATDAFEKAVVPSNGGSTDYQNWVNLADTLLWIPGRKQEANKYYRKAITLLEPILFRRPKDNELASKMALYLARLGEAEKSKAILDSLTKQNLDSPLVNYLIGLAYELIGDRKNALGKIKTAYDLGYPIFLIKSEPDLEALRQDTSYSLR